MRKTMRKMISKKPNMVRDGFDISNSKYHGAGLRGKPVAGESQEGRSFLATKLGMMANRPSRMRYTVPDTGSR